VTPGVIESRADDPLDAAAGVDLFLNRHFVGGATLQGAASIDVGALGILAEDDEINLGPRAAFERSEALVEEPDGAEIDV